MRENPRLTKDETPKYRSIITHIPSSDKTSNQTSNYIFLANETYVSLRLGHSTRRSTQFEERCHKAQPKTHLWHHYHLIQNMKFLLWHWALIRLCIFSIHKITVLKDKNNRFKMMVRFRVIIWFIINSHTSHAVSDPVKYYLQYYYVFWKCS